MIKLVRAKDDEEKIECYPLARFLYTRAEKVVKEHKTLFRKWKTEEVVSEEVPCYLVYVPKDGEVRYIFEEELLDPISEFTKSWVKSKDFMSHLPDDYYYSDDEDDESEDEEDEYEDDDDEDDSDGFMVKEFFGEKFIIDNNEFMCLWDGWELARYLKILYKAKPELLEY